MHSALWVADYITAIGSGNLTPLQILKMTYLSHGYTLAITNEPLISDKVEAWKYGPVIPTVYDALSLYGSDPVDSLHYCCTSLSSTGKIKERIEYLGKEFKDEEKEVIDCVVELYKDWTGGQLITLMHREGTPWSQHYVKGGVGVEIPDDSTKAFYKRLVDERQQ